MAESLSRPEYFEKIQSGAGEYHHMTIIYPP
jgi:hypothetical protein